MKSAPTHLLGSVQCVLREKNMRIDITLVLTLHCEGGYLFRAIVSLKEAVAFARREGNHRARCRSRSPE